MRAKVAERGQVTIPLPLRIKLGIKPGTILDFEIQKGRLVAVKNRAERSCCPSLWLYRQRF